MPPSLSAPSIASLLPLRHEIDEIDRRILALLGRRARVATRVAALKSALDLPTHDPGREGRLVAELVRQNRGPLDAAAIAHVFGAILATSRALMESVRARGAPAERETPTPCASRPRPSTPCP